MIKKNESRLDKESRDTTTLTAENVLRLAWLSQGEGFACGLTSAQWNALRYFGRANGPSRTLLAFADYHATTRGTASITVKILAKKGLLISTRSLRDARSFQINLTPKGRALCEKDPLKELVQTIAKLPAALQENLLAALEHMLGRVTTDRLTPQFGTCLTCFYLEECINQLDCEKSYFCHFAGEALMASEIEELCKNYKQDVA